MRNLKTSVLGMAGSALISTAAIAVDAPPVAVEPALPPTIAVQPDPVFDWGGLYLGGYGSAYLAADFDFVLFGWGAGGQAGYNVVLGERFLLGAEIGVGVSFWPSESERGLEVALTGRTGLLLGERTLVYAEAGYIRRFPPIDVDYLAIGGGLEVRVGNAISIFAEAAWLDYIGADFTDVLVKGGINWHVGD